MSKFYIDRKYIDNGLVTERAHPTEPYLIYNYTPQCQFQKAWDETTIQCRGLIVHKDTREVIARPFKKFFNYEEHVASGLPIPDEQPLVYEKLDGSLGILYWGTDGKPYIATRGSFTSEQAIWATNWFRKNITWDKYFHYRPSFTFLFEIIYPKNRIVVNYGSYQGLDLLAVIYTETGTDLKLPELSFDNYLLFPGNIVKPITFTSFKELKKRNEKNKEGFVLHYPISGLRLKIKFEDYVRLHKAITGLSEIGIWEMMCEGKDILQIVSEVPDEMHQWVKNVFATLLRSFADIECAAMQVQQNARNLPTRKEQAALILQSQYPSIVFAMLDNKDYKQIIWKMIRPKGAVTFRNDIDA